MTGRFAVAKKADGLKAPAITGTGARRDAAGHQGRQKRHEQKYLGYLP